MTLTRFAPRALGLLALLVTAGIAWSAQWIAHGMLDSPLVQSIGYAGVFLLTLTCSASLFLPVPSFGAIIVAGAALNPILVGIAGGCGAATGELTGYLAGRAGRNVASAALPDWTIRIQTLVRERGFLGLLILATVPNPLFDVAGITAGAMGYPPQRFWIAVALGKSVIYAVIASVGDQLLSGVLGA